MSTSFPLLAISLLLIIAGVFPLSQAAFCTYYRSSNRVRCGSVTCSTAEAGDSELPPGNYLVGNYYSHRGTPWFNLYRQRRSGGGYWDYHTKVPELGCRGGFGLHSGSHSEGCVTVTNSLCFSQLKSQIESNYRSVNFNAYECRFCLWGECRSGISTIRRVRTADLQSI